MKRTILLTIAVALAISMLFGLFGCAGSAPTGGSTTAAPAATTAAAAATTTAAADSDTAADSGSQNAGDESSASPGSEYEHMTFDVLCFTGDDELYNWPVPVEAMEHFNIDITPVPIPWNDWDTKVRTMAATGDLPEVIAWYNLQYGEYISWVAQDVFEPLPDDMSPYPNLYQITQDYRIYDKIKVNGKMYVFPKVINNNPYNEESPNLWGYRRDWARMLDLDYGMVQQVTWDEMIDFARKAKEADFAGMGDKFIALDGPNGYRSLGWFIAAYNPQYGKIYRGDDGKYVWAASEPSSLEGLLAVRDLYNEGLFAEDLHEYPNEAGLGRFRSGRTAVMRENYNVSRIQDAKNDMKRDIEGFDPEEDFGMFVVTSPVTGKPFTDEKIEWWGAFAFAGGCTPERMDRVLAFYDWLISEENLEKFTYGIYGEDWEKDANGDVTLFWPRNADDTQYELTAENGKEYITLQKSIHKWVVLEGFDVYLKGNPLIHPLSNTMFKETVELQKQLGADIQVNDYDYEYLSTPNKNEFGTLSTDSQEAVIRAVMSSNPEEEWQKFLDEAKPKIDSVLAEVNEALAN